MRGDWKKWLEQRKIHCISVAVILAGTALILYAGGRNGWQLIPMDSAVETVKPVEGEEAAAAGPEETLLPMQARDGQWGYVDLDGNMVIFPMYDEAGPFNENGLALVSRENMAGYIDKTGKWAVGPKEKNEYFDFEGVTELAFNEIAMQRAGITPETPEIFAICGKYGAIGPDGKVDVPFRYSYITPFAEADGRKLAIVTGRPEDEDASAARPKASKEELDGIIDDKGNVVAPCQYEYIQSFMPCGLAKFHQDYRYGLLDTQGKVVLEAEYDYIYDPAEKDRYLLAEKDGVYGVMDLDGNVIVPFQDLTYGDQVGLSVQEDGDETYAYGSSVFFLQDDGMETVKLFFGEDGRMIEVEGTDYAAYSSRENFIVIGQDGLYGVVNNYGEWVVEPSFDEVYPPDKQGTALVLKDDKWGVIDRTGKTAVPCVYDDIEYFGTDGLARTLNGGKYGYINRKGEIVVPIEYDEAVSIADIAEYEELPEDIAGSGYVLAQLTDAGRMDIYDRYGEKAGSMTYNGEDDEEAFLEIFMEIYGPETRYGYTREELNDIFIYETGPNDTLSYSLDQETDLSIVYDDDSGLYGLCDSEHNMLTEIEYDELYAAGSNGVFLTEVYVENEEGDYEEYRGALYVEDGRVYEIPAEYDSVQVEESGLIHCMKSGTSSMLNKYGDWVFRAYTPIEEK